MSFTRENICEASAKVVGDKEVRNKTVFSVDVFHKC